MAGPPGPRGLPQIPARQLARRSRPFRSRSEHVLSLRRSAPQEQLRRHRLPPDLVITSYQLLARDLAEHRAIGYGAVILDEAGFIRNPDTQAAQAARALTARVRFALTGTPIENGIRDLWSLMEFAVPGYLGPRKEFAERYESPLTSGGNAPLMARLRRRMAPYILRRLKQDVAKDLPSKIDPDPPLRPDSDPAANSTPA